MTQRRNGRPFYFLNYIAMLWPWLKGNDNANQDQLSATPTARKSALAVVRVPEGFTLNE